MKSKPYSKNSVMVRAHKLSKGSYYLPEENTMKKDKHTPEPWRVYGLSSIADNECLIFRPYHATQSKERKHANAKRIVECVNFCAGFSDEDLKKMGSLKELLEHRQRRAGGDPVTTFD